ncbi:MAG: sugar transferase [Pseudomonadota bacterium]
MAKMSRISVNVAHAYWERGDTPQRSSPSYTPERFASRLADVGPEGVYAAYGKRLFDVVGSFGLLVFFGPVVLTFLALTALDGGRPVFGHLRIGRNGRPFHCLKIRSMVVDADRVLQELLERDPVRRAEWYRAYKLDDDPRITRLGAFLRRSSLDELPQLLNVLRGEMSLVGPRPVPAVELERYGRASDVYASVRPGITGLWQVAGRNDVSYARRVAMDVHYVRQLGFWRDIGILLATVGAMLNTTGK